MLSSSGREPVKAKGCRLAIGYGASCLTAFQWFWRRVVLALYITGKAVMSPMAFGVNAIVEDDEGRVLLVRHTYMAGWHLPGGGVNSGEPPADAVIRELKEEIGLIESAPPELMGIFTRKLVWIGNVIALYRVKNAKFAFKRNHEIREILAVDPANPPPDVAPGSKRRLFEFANNTPLSHYW
jgi:ADP-ribose pyrophosphatase YjhB (NUDIX family)